MPQTKAHTMIFGVDFAQTYRHKDMHTDTCKQNRQIMILNEVILFDFVNRVFSGKVEIKSWMKQSCDR